MTENKYNIRIREAISDKYVDCSKRKQDKQKELTEILWKLSENKKTISYQDYIDLQNTQLFCKQKWKICALSLILGIKQEKYVWMLLMKNKENGNEKD